MAEKKKKVFVGMSGGVDSSLSAAILQDQGYDVTGIFIRVWQPDWIECTWREERRDAMRVAANLGIRFRTIDLSREYKEGVIDYMLREYKAGRTPNPDVFCNKEVKFGAFFKWAIQNGADYVATGHYARIEKMKDGSFAMFAGVDKEKDQSYFLWAINKSDLSKIIFPVGGMQKKEVRKLAVKFGLPTAAKKDSQGLCFIGHVDIKDFLLRYMETSTGNVLDEAGNVIGSHPGSLLFTIGERHGFTISNAKKGANDMPFYVITKDIKKNTITVIAGKKQNDSTHRTVILESMNWLNREGDSLAGKKISGRGRYRQVLSECVFDGRDTVAFEKSDPTLAPGQSLVLYDGEECLGGGIISQVK